MNFQLFDIKSKKETFSPKNKRSGYYLVRWIYALKRYGLEEKKQY